MRKFWGLFIPLFVWAQIPNSGFENWTNGEPDGWWTLNIPGLVIPVTQSSEAYSGGFGLKGQVAAFLDEAYPPFIGTGTSDNPFVPIDQNYTKVKGFVKFIQQNENDQFYGAIIIETTGSELLASGDIIISQSYNQYTPFEIDIEYLPETELNAEVMYMFFGIESNDSLQAGAYFLLDNLTLSTVTGLEKHIVTNPKEFGLNQNYPNPFNPETKINFQLPVAGYTNLIVYDSNGKEVKSLVNGDHLAGSYSVQFDGSDLPSGVYFYRLTSGSFSETKRMLLLK